MTGQKPDERIRTPMQWDATTPAARVQRGKPWEPLSDDWPTVNVAAESGRSGPRSCRAIATSSRLRAAHPALRTGSIVPVKSSADEVTATIRSGPTETPARRSPTSPTPRSATSAWTLRGAAVRHTDRPGRARPGDRDGSAADAAVAPLVTPTGGFTGYRPLPRLPPRSVTVIALHP